MTSNLSKLLLIVVLASLAVVSRASAQIQSASTISGTVVDSSGAAVPDAAITIVNEETSVATTTQSNGDGSFVVPGLIAGTYTVKIVKTGFQTYTEEHLVLHPGSTTAVNAALAVGQVTSEVSVVASAAQVQTTTGELANEVSGTQAATLPLNGRNYQSLAALMPGVTNLSPDTALGQGGFLTSSVMSVNGMGLSGTQFYLDGIWNMNSGDMDQTTITPNPDTIEEVRVLQNNYSVQYTLTGANTVLLETKSGTSTFHGSAFEYLRHQNTDFLLLPHALQGASHEPMSKCALSEQCWS